jgi:hypothetical protein
MRRNQRASLRAENLLLAYALLAVAAIGGVIAVLLSQ